MFLTFICLGVFDQKCNQIFHICCYCLVNQSRPTLCRPMDCSMPGFPVFHCIMELKLMSVELMMPSNHFIICHLLLLLSLISQHQGLFQRVDVFIRWPKYWSFSFSISPSNEYSGLISCGIDGLISLLFKEVSRVFSSTALRKHPFFTQPSLWSNSHIRTWLLEKP